jgi:hypothetical protein
MDWLTVINTSVGLMSLTLGGFAIWISLHLFTKAKDTEKEVAKTLEAIKAQSEALQKLTGRWMDRFTRHATEPKPADEGLLTLVATVANLPTTILAHLKAQPEISQPNAELLQETVNCYIAIYYYTGLANVMGQSLLPNEDNYNENEPWHVTVKTMVDISAKDFNFIAGVLGRVDQSRVNASIYKSMLDEAVTRWRPYIRNTEENYAAQKNL